MEEVLHIYHTADLHSHLDKWPKTRRRLQEAKKEAGTTMLIDLGDFIDRWHPLTEATNGRANVELMNEVPYDFATIGNNEGVGNSKAILNHLYDEAAFSVLLGNLLDPATCELPHWAEEYHIYETSRGTKLGLIGLTAYFPLTYGPNGWWIRRPEEALPEILEKVLPQVDEVILLSHLGVSEDIKLAEEFPEIAVILGSHTHHRFPHGRMIGTTLLAAAGKHGEYIGRVELVLRDHRIIGKSAINLATRELPALPADQKEAADYYEEGKLLLESCVRAELPYPLETDLQSPHPFVDTALEAVKEKGGTEAAILNSGLFLHGLPQGDVNDFQIQQALPHPMHLINVTLPGRELIRLIWEMEKNRFFLRGFPVIGMGFRGKIFGELIYSGIAYHRQDRSVTWNGEAIVPEKKYTFTTVDHLMFVPFFPTIELVGKIAFIFPEFLRQVVGEYLAERFPADQESRVK